MIVNAGFRLDGFSGCLTIARHQRQPETIPRHSAMNILNLTTQPITLITPDASHPIALTLNQIQQQLTHYPPSNYA